MHKLSDFLAYIYRGDLKMLASIITVIGAAVVSGELLEQAGSAIKCIVRLDRLRSDSWSKRGALVPKVKNFEIVRDIKLRWRDGKPPIYARVRELLSKHSATRAFWQYQRRKAWVKQWRVTLIADDLRGITAREAWTFFKHFRFPKLLLFELALDFHPSSGVDADFIRQHALFGKSRFRPDRGGAGQLRYGSRFSGKMVRCYQKNSVDAYRVEVELHSSLLPRPRRNNLREIIDSRWTEIGNAGFSIVPGHCRFVKLRFKALGRHLRQRFGERGDVLLEHTRALSTQSLHSALGYLRRKGIHNPHRFLQPLARINTVIEEAIGAWAADFLRPCHELDEIDGVVDKSKRAERTFQGGRK
jgi:hypothetical protein